MATLLRFLLIFLAIVIRIDAKGVVIGASAGGKNDKKTNYVTGNDYVCRSVILYSELRFSISIPIPTLKN